MTPSFRPGEVIPGQGEIRANEGRNTSRLIVRNLGDRPIQVGSHYHFFEVNRCLDFDRALAFGMRLNIPAGTSVRFEPGSEREIELVELGGARRFRGHCGLSEGRDKDQALAAAREAGFRGA